MESKPTYEKVLLSSLCLLITVILALLLSCPVLATEIEQQEEIETLNLKQLIDLALKNSPDLAAIKA
ncbi:MAG TPA: hypothetical protein ENG51_08280, partial [Deltaproteobacteria bacterium]|nr:hypothetical protein [Deltaproteobacteria bacterium]